MKEKYENRICSAKNNLYKLINAKSVPEESSHLLYLRDNSIMNIVKRPNLGTFMKHPEYHS